MKIGITGGSGFIGSHLVKAFKELDCSLNLLTHDKTISGINSKYKVVQGSINNYESLVEFCNEAEIIVHLIGIIAETRTKTFQNTVAEGTKNLVRAAQFCNVKKIIYLSALGTSPDANTKYHQTKYIAEQLIIKSNINYLILRPSVIYGPGDGFINLLQGLLKIPLITPIVGHGKYLLQPVYIDDLVNVIKQSVFSDNIKNEIIDIAGVEKLEYLEILNILKKQLNKKSLNFHLPLKLMKLVAMGLEKIIKPAPVTVDQLKMMEMGNTGDIKRMKELFKFEPVLFADGLNRYL